MTSSPPSLAHFLRERQRAGRIDTDLRLLLETCARACKTISAHVNRGALAGVLGAAGTVNVQAEEQKKLDVVSNDILIEANARSGSLAALASEEMERPLSVAPPKGGGPYLLVFDPLDGSSNIDVNVPVGTIFSVLRCPEGVRDPDERAFLQPGRAQVAAGFAVYGPATMFVLTVGDGAHGFTLDAQRGSFMLTHPQLRIPPDTAEFAINMSNQRRWEPPVRRYIDECLAGKEGPRGKDFNMRWIASMVADVYRVLSRGGVFLYPSDSRYPQGRLRLMYEAMPMALIVEQAGGAATDGRTRLLDIVPSALHQRVPVVLGSRHEVERLATYHAD